MGVDCYSAAGVCTQGELYRLRDSGRTSRRSTDANTWLLELKQEHVDDLRSDPGQTRRLDEWKWGARSRGLYERAVYPI